MLVSVKTWFWTLLYWLVVAFPTVGSVKLLEMKL